MNISFQTKFDENEIVFFIDSNKIKRGIITDINLSFSTQSVPGHPKSIPTILYFVDVDGAAQTNFLESDNKLFKSKEELINSL